MSNEPQDLTRALTDLAHVVSADSALTKPPVTTTARAVITSLVGDGIAKARVGIALTPTTCFNSLPNYVPTVNDVVTITRNSRRQYITGHTAPPTP